MLRLDGLRIPLINGFFQKLTVAEPVHGKDHFPGRLLFLLVYDLFSVLDHGPPLHRELLPDPVQILLDDRIHVFLAGQDMAVFPDPF